MVKLHLIRHGETQWNLAGRMQGRKNSELTPLGKEQAGQLADTLKPGTFDQIISSTSKRSIQTAEILAKKLNIKKISQNKAFCEINLGPWEGQFSVELEKAYPDQFYTFWNKPDTFSLEGAETFLALQKRGVKEIHKIANEHVNKELIIISHGAMIKSILCHFAGRLLCNLWYPPRMYNCAHSIITFTENGTGTIEKFAGQYSW